MNVTALRPLHLPLCLPAGSPTTIPLDSCRLSPSPVSARLSPSAMPLLPATSRHGPWPRPPSPCHPQSDASYRLFVPTARPVEAPGGPAGAKSNRRRWVLLDMRWSEKALEGLGPEVKIRINFLLFP